MAPRTGLDSVENRNMSCPAGNRTPISPVHSLVTIPPELSRFIIKHRYMFPVLCRRCIGLHGVTSQKIIREVVVPVLKEAPRY